MSIELLSDVLGVFSAFAVIAITLFVFKWTQKRDRLEALRHSWQEAQGINLTVLQDQRAAEVFEKMVYDREILDSEKLLVDCLLFLYINRVRHDYLAFTSELIDRATFERYSAGTLKLIVSQKKRVRYLLLERGYDPTFMGEVMDLLNSGKIVRPRTQEELNQTLRA